MDETPETKRRDEAGQHEREGRNDRTMNVRTDGQTHTLVAPVATSRRFADQSPSLLSAYQPISLSAYPHPPIFESHPSLDELWDAAIWKTLSTCLRPRRQPRQRHRAHLKPRAVFVEPTGLDTYGHDANSYNYTTYLTEPFSQFQANIQPNNDYYYQTDSSFTTQHWVEVPISTSTAHSSYTVFQGYHDHVEQPVTTPQGNCFLTVADSFAPFPEDFQHPFDQPQKSPEQIKGEILEEIVRECEEIEKRSSTNSTPSTDCSFEDLDDESSSPASSKPVRKEKKKAQNRLAATRYREKKRRERELKMDTISDYTSRNKLLNEKAMELQREITYLRNLMKEIGITV